MTGLVSAGLVAVLLLFLSSLLADLPQTALAAVVITTTLSSWTRVSSAIRPGPHLSVHSEPRRCRWRDSPGRQPGDHRGNHPRHPVVLSAKLVGHGTVLGEVPEMRGWYSTAMYPGVTQLPGVVVFRWEAPLFFANCGQFRDQLRRLARAWPPAWIVLQCEAVTDIDVTAAEVLKALMRSSMIAACIWHSSSHAVASRTWCAAMASTPRWTETTSIPASTRPSMRSTMRPRTALCRPMKGCRLHEHRH